MSFPYLDETKELNETTRQPVDGSFIALTDGITHYELGGPENGKLVVLVHGFSVPYFIFDTTFNFLVKLMFPYVKGIYAYNGAQLKTSLYVSPGTGTWGPPMRLGSRCEITLINLRSRAQGI